MAYHADLDESLSHTISCPLSPRVSSGMPRKRQDSSRSKRLEAETSSATNPFRTIEDQWMYVMYLIMPKHLTSPTLWVSVQKQDPKGTLLRSKQQACTSKVWKGWWDTNPGPVWRVAFGNRKYYQWPSNHLHLGPGEVVNQPPQITLPKNWVKRCQLEVLDKNIFGRSPWFLQYIRKLQWSRNPRTWNKSQGI